MDGADHRVGHDDGGLVEDEEQRRELARRIRGRARPEWEGDPSAEPAIKWMSLAVVGLAVLGLVGGWLLFGWTAHRTLIVRTAMLLPLVAAVAIALGMCARGPRNRLRTALVVALVEGVLVAWVLGTLLGDVRPTVVELEATLKDLRVPYAAAGPPRTSGDRWCREQCPTVTQAYRIPPGAPAPEETVRSSLAGQGWRLPENTLSSALRRGNVKAEVFTTANDRGVVFVALGS